MFAANLPVNIVERASLSWSAVLIDGSKVKHIAGKISSERVPVA